jgi:hypothetical protein
MQMCFRSGSAKKKAVSEEVVDEKISPPVVGGTLPCHGTFGELLGMHGHRREQ